MSKQVRDTSAQPPELNPLWHHLATHVGGYAAASAPNELPPIQAKYFSSPLIQRQCPECEEGLEGTESLGIQVKPTVGAPDDEHGKEAYRLADKAMRLPDTDIAQPTTTDRHASEHRLQHRHPVCDEEIQRQPEDEEEALVQPKRQSSPTLQVDRTVEAKIRAVRDSGRPLPGTERTYFEPRFGHDLSRIRLHTDLRSAEVAKAVNARAFTLGRDIYFGRRSYQPGTTEGRRLVAHELTHTIQQAGAPRFIQRRLAVSGNRPTDLRDPLSRFPNNAAFQAAIFPAVDILVQALCDRFEVDTGGRVREKRAGDCANPMAVATGAKPTGCCCLCVLTGSGNTWTIKVSRLRGPHTNLGTRDIFIHPDGSDFEFGAFTAAGTLTMVSQVSVLGHEACGHAALHDLNIHPIGPDRIVSARHDPTVKIENIISTEQGVVAARMRGLAASGIHRGESVARIILHGFPINRHNISDLPPGEQAKFDLAVAFSHPTTGNNTWVDILGHSDAQGSPSAKLSVSQQRADSVKSAMISRGVTRSITKDFQGATGRITIRGKRYTRVEGRSDRDLLSGPGPTDPRQRRVEIIMAGRPAGAQVPIPTTPRAIAPTDPQSGSAYLNIMLWGDACERLLARSAWT